MHKQQNKHGPGAEAGTCIAWLLRPEAVREPVQAAGLRADGSPPPLRAGPHEKEWPPGNTKVQRRRRRRRCLPEKACLAWHQGEGPPGDAIRLIINNIDPAARSRLPARGHLQTRDLKTFLSLMGEVCPEGTRDAKDGTRDVKKGRGTLKMGRGDETKDCSYKNTRTQEHTNTRTQEVTNSRTQEH